jgi:transposase
VLSLPPAVRVFLCNQPTDLRRSIDGLALAADTVLRQDPYSGHLFVFRNRRGNRLKILYWDRDGFAIWYKRLEQGSFRLPRRDGASAEVEAVELAMMLEGVDPARVRRRKRFIPPRRSFGR